MAQIEKNKITINRKELSSKKVQEKENLDTIISKHRKMIKRPAYKQKRVYFFLFLLLITSLLIYYADKEENNKEVQQTEQSN